MNSGRLVRASSMKPSTWAVAKLGRHGRGGRLDGDPRRLAGPDTQGLTGQDEVLLRQVDVLLQLALRRPQPVDVGLGGVAAVDELLRAHGRPVHLVAHLEEEVPDAPRGDRPQYACLTLRETSVAFTSTPAWVARMPCSAACRAFVISPQVKIGWMISKPARMNTPVMSRSYFSSGEYLVPPGARGRAEDRGELELRVADPLGLELLAEDLLHLGAGLPDLGALLSAARRLSSRVRVMAGRSRPASGPTRGRQQEYQGEARRPT